MTRQAAIDACVHNCAAAESEIVEHLPAAWRRYIGRPGTLPNGGGAMPIVPLMPYHNPLGNKLRSATGVLDAPPGSDPATVLAEHLDAHAIERAVLCLDREMFIPALPNVRLSIELCRAVNSWTEERWLAADPRLHGVILAPLQVPELAAAEILRAARNDRMAAVLFGVNGLNKPVGHPVYDPIFRAAADSQLPVIVHAGLDCPVDTLTDPVPGGPPSTYTDFHVLQSTPLATSLVSLIGQGVFERYPDLKVLLVGGGVTWLAPLMWRFDTDFRALRRDAPYLRMLPSEYVRDRIRVSTYPLEVADASAFQRYLTAYDGLDGLLCYASGYPNWDCDTPERVGQALPAAWGERVMRTNALELFRW